MPIEITITKVASAYIDLNRDTPERIPVNEIVNFIPVPAVEGIGASIIFLLNGTSINVVETVEQISTRIKQGRLFEYGFSKS